MKTLASILLITMALLAMSMSAPAQVGSWNTYTDMKVIRCITGSGSAVWAATSGGVFYSSSEGDVTSYTNVDGLSAIDYSAIAATADGFIIAGAVTGMINVFVPGEGWFEVSDIARAEEYQLRGITTIEAGAGRVFIGTDFGLTEYDIGRREFGDTNIKFGDLPTQSRVNDIHFTDSEIWVATEYGVAYGDLGSANLKDPENWTSYAAAAGMDLGDVRAVSSLGPSVMIATADKFFLFEGNAWREILGGFGSGENRRLFHSGQELYIVTDYSLYRVVDENNVDRIGDRLDNGNYPVRATMTDISALADGTLLLATTAGFSEYHEQSPWTLMFPNGPNTNIVNSFSVDADGVLWNSSGFSGGGGGIYAFDGSLWNNYATLTHPEMLTDAVVCSETASDGSTWFGTWGKGIIIRSRDDSFSHYNKSNVPDFPGLLDAPDFSPVSAIVSDLQGNLWTLHFRNNGNLVGCYTADGRWIFYRSTNASGPLVVADMAIDQYGTKWIIVQSTPYRGLLLFNDGGTLEDPGDDTWLRLSANDSNGLNANENVTAIAVDMLGDVWVGTDRGLRTIFDPLQPDRVTKTCFNTRCNIEGLYITSIAIDPVNNKWIGTKDGVFVLTPDGSEIIATYSTDNSPLLANEVISIIVHPATGVAYIATKLGLSSVSTAFVEPETSFGELKLSPNPFRPGRDEKVMVDGLVEGSSLKILSVSGNLVAEVPSPGGRIGFWNGRTKTGEYAPSGVYFVIAYSSDGKQAAAAKLAVIRE